MTASPLLLVPPAGVTGFAGAISPAGAGPAAVGGRRRHADRDGYRRWLRAHTTSDAVRCQRLRVYDEFVACWPDLRTWFTAPLAARAADRPDAVPGHNPHGANALMPYLVYLSLVQGVSLDYNLLLVRTFRTPFTPATYRTGLGVDLDLFEGHVARLTRLGYAPNGARADLGWTLGRILLHHGDPDLTAVTEEDLKELRAAVEAFSVRPDAEQLRAFYRRSDPTGPPVASVEQRRRWMLTRLQGAHMLLFHTGRVTRPPSDARHDAGDWTQHLVPVPAPPAVAAVVDRYLRLRLEANLDRPQTVRHARDALRRLLVWLAQAHPELTSLAELTRGHAEEFLRWLGVQRNTQTGAPLGVGTRRTVITLLAGFIADTASWQWDDVPGRILFTRADMAKMAKTLPRFLPAHDLDTLMAAVDGLPDPHQRAALIVARWSGARRDEIRRLAVDCLDTYPDGHPRLRIPVGKGHAERSIPLHPQAADVLRPLIDLAHRQGAAPRFDPSAGRVVQHVFLRRGKLLSNGFLFDLALKAACTAAGLLDPLGRPTVSAHRFRHTIGTALAEGGARLQTIMAVLGHRTPAMSLLYASLSDPVVKQEYADALTRSGGGGIRLAGPAAEALRSYRLDPAAVHWLQTNFLKTELELGHCLRLPQEGPCECDLVLTCAKFVTTDAYTSRLRARLALEQQLIDDADTRGWPREVERHQATQRRLQGLLVDLERHACEVAPPGEADTPPG